MFIINTFMAILRCLIYAFFLLGAMILGAINVLSHPHTNPNCPNAKKEYLESILPEDYNILRITKTNNYIIYCYALKDNQQLRDEAIEANADTTMKQLSEDERAEVTEEFRANDIHAMENPRSASNKFSQNMRINYENTYLTPTLWETEGKRITNDKIVIDNFKLNSMINQVTFNHLRDGETPTEPLYYKKTWP